ncbi:MAG: DUF4317 domain-containing protein [Clostridia bacterium]|nr:DUF4317 domain-containing protein [Clostridia bacterium]
MNDREIATIRRRMRPEKNNVGRIRGCYVNDNHTIISEFDQMLGMISDNEAEEILSLLRRTLSGTIGRNLIDISFSNQQVLDSDEHRLLSSLRNSSLSDSDAVKAFFEKTIASLELEGSYFILIANDKYDIFTYNEDGEKNDSSEMFSYILCAVCPIKAAKPSLGYNLSENKFKNIIRDSMISAPEIGFMFPAFDSNSANIYNALFYTRDVSLSHESFTKAIFNTEMPLPATEQTESIAGILNSTVAEGCSLELVQAVQGQLLELAADHKANKEEEPLMLSSKDMGSLLRFGGVNEETVSAFSEKIEEDLGVAAIPPANIIDIKKFEVKTPEVTVKVSPEHSDLIETRVIDGTKYLLIRADGDVEVNGIRININE